MSVIAKSIKVNSDSSPAKRTETDFSPLSSSETKNKYIREIILEQWLLNNHNYI